MKNEAITIDEARELAADPALWPRVRDFLWDFVPQVHPSWWEGLAGECQKPGVQDAAASAVDFSASGIRRLADAPRAKAWLLDRLGVVPCFHSFPKDDWSRLLLLDGTTLLGIVQWLGALACADSLRRVTDGTMVRTLKATLPGVYPDVFSFTAYFSGFDFQCGAVAPQRCVDEVESTGYSMLTATLASLPDVLVSRMKFKFPKNLCTSASLRLKNDACRKAVAKLLKLKFPEAYSLCC